MTRKDYQAIADAFAPTYAAMLPPDGSEDTARELQALHERHGAQLAIRAVANALQADNPRFDRARFLKACGLTITA